VGFSGGSHSAGEAAVAAIQAVRKQELSYRSLQIHYSNKEKKTKEKRIEVVT